MWKFRPSATRALPNYSQAKICAHSADAIEISYYPERSEIRLQTLTHSVDRPLRAEFL